MTAAIATAHMSEYPDRITYLWMSRGVVITLLVTAFAIVALAGSGEAGTCEGTPLTTDEQTLPELIHPA